MLPHIVRKLITCEEASNMYMLNAHAVILHHLQVDLILVSNLGQLSCN